LSMPAPQQLQEEPRSVTPTVTHPPPLWGFDRQQFVELYTCLFCLSVSVFSSSCISSRHSCSSLLLGKQNLLCQAWQALPTLTLQPQIRVKFTRQRKERGWEEKPK
jgi:hypothetical protein